MSARAIIEPFETRKKMSATAQNVAFKVDLRQSPYAGRYALDAVLCVNGSQSRLQFRDQTGVSGEVNAGQPLQLALKPTGLQFVVVPLDAAGVLANEVMLYLKWRPLGAGESIF